MMTDDRPSKARYAAAYLFFAVFMFVSNVLIDALFGDEQYSRSIVGAAVQAIVVTVFVALIVMPRLQRRNDHQA